MKECQAVLPGIFFDKANLFFYDIYVTKTFNMNKITLFFFINNIFIYSQYDATNAQVEMN